MELQWPLIIFTTFICLAAGTIATVALATLKQADSGLEFKGAIVSLAALVIGGLASVLHLQTPSRYFGQFGNISSGINQEIAAMGLLGIVVIIYLVQLQRSGKAASAVKVLAALLAVVLVLVMSHSYMMPSIPAWDTLLLPLYYLLNAAALGLLVTKLLQLTGKPGDKAVNLGSWPLIALVVFAAGVVAYAAYIATLSGANYSAVLHSDISTVPPVDPASIGSRLFSGDLAGIFWGGVVVVGLAAPIVCALVGRKPAEGKSSLAVGAVTCGILLLLVGNVAFRALLYFAGSSVFIY
ncbi:MAG: dimethyl sulfoxide reductase anchor subunit [Coriobacteriales bacterium]|jgi:anaerobic dimethyl sulfoxide reductase subunit C (anchor subunit)|nr:dimethyl sulfoxide reductase anchor subunit [Coriobacteriales bacterium]